MSPLINCVTRACCSRDTAGQGRPRARRQRAGARLDESQLQFRERHVTAGDDQRSDDDERSKQREEEREARRARLRSGGIEHVRGGSLDPAGTVVGGGQQRQQRHQQQQADTLERRGQTGQRRTGQALGAGKGGKVAHKPPALLEEAVSRNCSVGAHRFDRSGYFHLQCALGRPRIVRAGNSTKPTEPVGWCRAGPTRTGALNAPMP
jgi:hypothetical protein